MRGTILSQIEVDGLFGSVECVVSHDFISYVARITRSDWAEEVIFDQWGVSRIVGRFRIIFSIAKSYGTQQAAEDWLLDQLEFPSFVYLAN